MLIQDDKKHIATTLCSPPAQTPPLPVNWTEIAKFSLAGGDEDTGWNGTIDDFAIYNEVINEATRNTLYTNGVAATISEPSSTALIGLAELSLIIRRRR